MGVDSMPTEKNVTPRRRGLVRAGVILGACLLLGVIETTQRYVGDLLNATPTSFPAVLGRVLSSWVILAAPAPAVLRVSDRCPLDRGHGLRHVPAHLATFVPPGRRSEAAGGRTDPERGEADRRRHDRFCAR